MLVCNKCGTLVEGQDLPYVIEMHGEKHRNTKCKCGGEFIPARQCKLCGKWFDNTELHGICEGCLSEEETVDNALEVGSYSQEKVSINGFIADALTPKQINKILIKWVEENFTDHSKAVVDYLEGDMSAFADFLEDTYKE